MKKFIFLVVISILAIIAVGCGDNNNNASSEDDGVQDTKIKFSHVVAENTPKHQGAEAMKEYVEDESDGKIEMEIYPDSSLFGDDDEIENLVSNNVQFIAPDLSKLVGHNPQFNVPSLPFAFDNDEAAEAFWDGDKGQEVLESLKDDGVLGLYMWPNGGKQITYNGDPVKSPEDFKGMKFRTQGGQVLESLYEELGAGSESIAFDELYNALDQGVVDGEENTWSNIESKKFDEVQDYTTELNHTRVDYAVFTNTEFWDGLNDETKEIVEDGLEKGTEVARENAAQLAEEGKDTIKERGDSEVIELSDDEIESFRDALEPIYDKFEDDIGKDVYEAVEDANDEYGDK